MAPFQLPYWFRTVPRETDNTINKTPASTPVQSASGVPPSKSNGAPISAIPNTMLMKRSGRAISASADIDTVIISAPNR